MGAGWKTHLDNENLGRSGMELFFLRTALLGSSEDEVLILRQRTRRMIPEGARRCSCILARRLRGERQSGSAQNEFSIRSEVRKRLRVESCIRDLRST